MKIVNFYIWSVVQCGAETWKFREVFQKYLEMWWWKRIEKLSWTSRVKNKEYDTVREDRNALQTIKRRKANWFVHILRRNCLLKHAIEGKDISDRKMRKKT